MSRRSIVSQQKKKKSSEPAFALGNAAVEIPQNAANTPPSVTADVSVQDSVDISDTVDSLFAELAGLESCAVANETVSAIEAAEEILSQTHSETVVTASSPNESAPTDINTKTKTTRSKKSSVANTANTGTRNPIAAANPSNTDAESLRVDLRDLGETLRSEFRNSIGELQAAQAAGIAAQSEVLRMLTEMIFQTAGSQELSPETVERAFSGIEERLLVRIEAVAGGVRTAAGGLSSNGDSSAFTKSPAAASGVKLQNAAGSVNRSWEQIRNEMMSRGELDETSTVSNESEPSAQLHDVAQLTSDRHFRLPEQDPSLEIPRTVDPETLSDHELRDAFRAREIFITTLIARIRRQQELATGQLSPEQLRTLVTELPEQLATQVRHTLKQMEDLARMGELELSLERARIARQVNQLEHTRLLIERNARQLGLTVNPDGTISGSSNQPGKGSSSRRWLGKLGFGQ